MKSAEYSLNKEIEIASPAYQADNYKWLRRDRNDGERLNNYKPCRSADSKIKTRSAVIAIPPEEA
ncbi:MAG: hypothetical protein J0I84_17750 [Terrimonas sp.]|nr:hypothetical protein [Terrimonas sp.]OJZ00011.1 MAG: hypothetical protein BGP13_09285 [Sphingobacteriales bacterium 40-81]